MKVQWDEDQVAATAFRCGLDPDETREKWRKREALRRMKVEPAFSYAGHFKKGDEIEAMIHEACFDAFHLWRLVAEPGEWVSVRTKKKKWPVLVICAHQEGLNLHVPLDGNE